MVLGVDFYGEVLLELVTALGAALFVANAFALARRRSDARRATHDAVARGRPGSPVSPPGAPTRTATTGDLGQVPIARTVTFMVVGLLVAIWGIASLTT